MGKDQETLDTYNNSAQQFSEYFKGIGSREDDIEKAVKLTGLSDKPDVLEIGCGDGRDAAEIIPRAKTYTGIDYSEGLIDIARERLSHADFQVADMQTWVYPENSFDIVFAFASLLHIDKEGNVEIAQKVARTLRKGGIFFVSLKRAEEYEERVQEDEFGKRVFYYYNPEGYAKLCEPLFKEIYRGRKLIGHTNWFEMALKKN